MDDASEGRWLTFAELAQARGISEASARKLVRRHKWRRQAGNQGIVRILVPAEALDRPRDGLGTDPAHILGTDLSDTSRAISTLEAAISTLREQFEQANRRADRTEQATAAERARADALQSQLAVAQGEVQAKQAATLADAATIAALRDHLAQEISRAEAELHRADRAEQGREGERARADALRDRLNAMQAQLADAHAALQAAEAADARAARAEQRADAATVRADAAEGRAHRADDQAAELRERIDTLQGEAATLRATLATAEAGRDSEQHARADVLQAQLKAAERASDELQAKRILADERGGRAENQVLDLQAQIAAAQVVSEQAGREAEEARREAQAILEAGLWARLRRAWRGK
jgi:chromosome segregation ATPase